MVSLTNKTLTIPSVTNGAVSGVGVTDTDFISVQIGEATIQNGTDLSMNNSEQYKYFNLSSSYNIQSVSVYVDPNGTITGGLKCRVYHLDGEGNATFLGEANEYTYTDYTAGNEYITLTFAQDLFVPAGETLFAFIASSTPSSLRYVRRTTTPSPSISAYLLGSNSYVAYETNQRYAVQDSTLGMQVYFNGHPSVGTNELTNTVDTAESKGQIEFTDGGGTYWDGNGNPVLIVNQYTFDTAWKPKRVLAQFKNFGNDTEWYGVGAIYNADRVLMAQSELTFFEEDDSADFFVSFSFGESVVDLPAGTYWCGVIVDLGETDDEAAAIKLADSSSITGSISGDAELASSFTFNLRAPTSYTADNTFSEEFFIKLFYEQVGMDNSTFSTTWKDQTQTWASTTETWGDLVDYTDVTNTT